MPLTPPQPPSPPPGIELAPGVFAPHDSLRIQFARGSGPGGQNVNKLNTKAELWLDLSSLHGLSLSAIQRLKSLAGSRLTLDNSIHLSCDESRSQESNRSEILRRLRDLILLAKREPKRRRKTKPTYASKQRRLESKKHKSQIKANRRGPAH